MFGNRRIIAMGAVVAGAGFLGAAPLFGAAHSGRTGAMHPVFAQARPAQSTDAASSDPTVIDAGKTYKANISATCYDANGNQLTDTVTSVISGQPTTGGATAKMIPNPAQTFTNIELRITTSTSTDAGVYMISISGQGTACGNYTPYVFALTVKPVVSLKRDTVSRVEATGMPVKGGSFSYTAETVGGDGIAAIRLVKGASATSNPNVTALAAPDNGGGAPAQGGLGSYKAVYTVAGLTADNDKFNPFRAATFGMSCYYTTLQSDWGAAPSNCGKVKISGTVYSGTVDNPNGLPGTYCSAFIAEVKLQGSAVLNDGRAVQYNPSSQVISVVKHITTADGTSLIAGKTVARDKFATAPSQACKRRHYGIIPVSGVTVDTADVGSGLHADDTGCAITNYRLDLYNGAGQAVCTNYPNPITVAACNPDQKHCPAKDLQ